MQPCERSCWHWGDQCGYYDALHARVSTGSTKRAYVMLGLGGRLAPCGDLSGQLAMHELRDVRRPNGCLRLAFVEHVNHF